MKASYKASLDLNGLGKETECKVTMNTGNLYLHSHEVGFPITVPTNQLTHADYLSHGVLVLNYGTYPYHVLRIYSAEALQDFKKTYADHALSRKLGTSSNRTFGVLALSVVLSIIAFLVIFYFWVLPLFAGWAADKVSPAYERSLGRQMHYAYLAKEKKDTALSRKATNFFHQLNYAKADSVMITVIESNEVNAFALPGGFIFLPKGMIAALQTPGQLAALLSHEFVHARNRHSLRSMIANASGKITLMILLGGFDDNLIQMLLSGSEDLRDLSFSRDLESESDRVGMELMAEQGIQPAEMVGLLEILSKQQGVEVPAFLSTHPVFEERIPEARAIAGQLKVIGKEHLNHGLFKELKMK